MIVGSCLLLGGELSGEGVVGVVVEIVLDVGVVVVVVEIVLDVVVLTALISHHLRTS